MKKTEGSVWHKRPEGANENEGYLGFVFFRSDEYNGGVLYSRVADPTLRLGENFWLRLGVSMEERHKLRELMFETDAVWLLSKLGVGLLYKRYDLWTGYYLYVHFHDDPQALGALLSRGRLLTYSPLMAVHGLRKKTEGICDEMTATRFLKSLERVQAMKRRLEKPHEGNLLYVEELYGIADAAAELAGFSLVLEYGDGDLSSMPGHYARLAEGLLLYWLGVASMLSVDGRVKMAGKVAANGRDQTLILGFETVVNREELLELTPKRYQLFLNYDHMAYKSEISGVRTYWTADELSEEEPMSRDIAADGQSRYLKLTFHVSLEKDPFRDAAPAFKVKSPLIYDEE